MKEAAKHNKFSSNSSKPLAAEVVLGEVPILKEPRLLNKWVVWLEQRPNEGGRTTVLIRPWGCSQFPGQELTPAPIDVRTRVHSYGGGALATFAEGDELLFAWIDDSDSCLWTQSWKPLLNPVKDKGLWIETSQSPICLSRKSNYALADGLIDPLRKRWIGVMEKDEVDFLVSFALNKEFQHPVLIYCPEDFIGYAALSPNGSQLVWVEWQQPSMPWESSQLWLGSFNNSGEIKKKTLIAGSSADNQGFISVFQPIWMPQGELVVSEDRSGWWNLMITGPNIDIDSVVSWRRLWSMKAETAMPQWVYGMSTTSSAGENIATSTCVNGSWQINILGRGGSISTFEQPYDDLQGMSADKNRILAIASNPLHESGLLEIDLNLGNWTHKLLRESILDKSQISVPESLWFEGFGGQKTHAWYYPPANWNGLAAPLLVKSHSGPTGMAGRGLNLSIQYWTSRGWGVVDVNYGGSSGFGRSYRERLRGRWGEVDVFDCSAAAKSLVASGKADSKLLAIEGGSAGGFTTLACLCFTDLFRVGACRYGVSDLISMAKETHRFEMGYLDYLVGTWPDQVEKYQGRSPLNHAERIECPVIFFQGLKDMVVLPAQTERMADALREKDIPVEVHTFTEEGHGFRNANSKIKVLELTEKFFRKHLGL